MTKSKRIYKSFSTVNENRTRNGQIFNIDTVKQDIINLAKTRKGEFPMIPNLGFLIHDYLFNPELTDAEANLILDDAREQLSADPRIEFINGQVLTLQNRQGLALILSVNVKPFDEDINLTIEFDSTINN